MTDLIAAWKEAKKAEQYAINARRTIEQEISKQYADTIAAQLDKDYGTGTVGIACDDGKLTLSFPKKIDWDGEQLAEFWDRIDAHGENPAEYMERKLTVAESKYKAFPSNIRTQFEPARTVKAGNPTFTFKEKK